MTNVNYDDLALIVNEYTKSVAKQGDFTDRLITSNENLAREQEITQSLIRDLCEQFEHIIKELRRLNR